MATNSQGRISVYRVPVTRIVVQRGYAYPDRESPHPADSGTIDNCNVLHYTSQVIRSFRHKPLRELFESGRSKHFRPDLAKKLRIQMDFLNRAESAQDMDLPGYRFHPLKGDRAGTYALMVTGNYRMTFTFSDGGADDVDYEDCH